MAAPLDLTETGLVNGALALIGEPPVTSLNDATRAAARYARTFFADERDELLRSRDWQFARHFAQPAGVPCPNPAWTYRYTMPADCLAVVRIGDFEDYTDQSDWESPSTGDDRAVGIVVDTDAVSPLIYYTRRVANPAQWHADFRALFKVRLAARLNPLIGRDKALTDKLEGASDRKEERAAKRDSQDRSGDTLTRTTSWVTSRWGVRNGAR